MRIIGNFSFILTIMASGILTRAEALTCSEFPSATRRYQAAKISLPPEPRDNDAAIEIYFETDVMKDACNTWSIEDRPLAQQPICSESTAGRTYVFDGAARMTLMACGPERVPGIVRSKTYVIDAADTQVIYFPKRYRLKARIWMTSRDLPVTPVLDGRDMEQRK